MRFIRNVFCSALCFLAPTLAWANSQTFYPSSESVQTVHERAWTAENKLETLDGLLADCGLPKDEDRSDTLYVKYASVNGVIPAGSTITGIEFNMENFNDQNASGILLLGYNAQIYNSGKGGNIGTPKSGYTPIDDGSNFATVGSSSDLWGSSSSTLLAALDTNFGVLFYIADGGQGGGMDVGMDAISFTIYWNPPPVRDPGRITRKLNRVMKK